MRKPSVALAKFIDCGDGPIPANYPGHKGRLE